MQIAVLGTGRIGAVHAATLFELPAVERVVICDVDEGRARNLAERLSAAGAGRVDVAADPEALVRGTAPSGRLDAVVIATPTPTHAPLLLAAVEAGVPAFCEKPIALGVPETVDVVRAVRASGLPVTIGFQRRSDPAHLELRDRLRSGALGTPYLVRMVVGDDAPPPAAYVAQSGGVFRDQAVHDVDALRFVTGAEVEEVQAFGALRTGAPGLTESGDVDTAASVLRLTDGTLATLTSSRHSAGGYDVRMEVAGSGGVAAVGSAGGPVHTDASGVALATSPDGGFVERFAAAYRAELRAFTELVAGRGGNPCTVEDALAALVVAGALQQSLTERRPVRPADLAPAI